MVHLFINQSNGDPEERAIGAERGSDQRYQKRMRTPGEPYDGKLSRTDRRGAWLPEGQHWPTLQLLIGFINYFGCGRYKARTNSDLGDYKVSKFKDIAEKIIPFFKKYQIIGVKALDFED